MSTRQNQDFLNPTPSKGRPDWSKEKSAKHGNLGAQLDKVDDYADAEDDHTKQYFNGKKGEFGEVVGDRRFKPNIADLMGELDQKIYGGEVTSRKQRDQSASQSSGGEEEGEDEDESGEAEEESAEEKQNDSEDEKEDQKEEANSDSASAKGKEAEDVITKLTKGKNDNQVDQILNKLKSEEKVNVVENTQRQASDIQKAKCVKVQKKICDQTLQQRILLQKPMSQVAKFPNEDFFQNISKSSALTSKIQECKRKTKQHIKNLSQIQKDLFQLSETAIKIKVQKEESTDDDSGDISPIWKTLESNFTKTMPFIEETINRWNERNQTINTQNKKGALNKTIIEQVNLTLGDGELRSKAQKKTQYKRETYRVLGADRTGVDDEYDTNLFNDYDLYQSMLSDFLNQNDKNDDTVNQNVSGAGGNDDYLYGADLSMTQKYLIKRQKLKELAAIKKKEIDRKATKGRKIRFVVHDKLQSFMTPMENIDKLEGKDQLMTNLFGQNQNMVVVEKKSKSSKRQKKEEGLSSTVMLL